jgi:hypothetical protein
MTNVSLNEVCETFCEMEEDFSAIHRWSAALILLGQAVDEPLQNAIFEIGTELERRIETIQEKRDTLYLRLGERAKAQEAA